MNDDSPSSPPSDADAFLRELARAPDASAPLPEPDLTGRTLGRYQVGARLGAGGMGVVYEATDPVLQRKVALKVLLRRTLGDESARARLLREARSLAAVSHPGIAAIYEVGEADGLVFIAMERALGETLRAHLARRGRLELSEARRLVTEIARALAHAHRAGVVHRDLKPENVMVTPSGEVKLLDFGLAKAVAGEPGSGEQLTSTLEGHLVGTPGYMSPEQARGQRVDGRSDLFALGAILYELVTGRRAFDGASLVEVLAAIDRDTPTPPRQLRPEASVELERTILRCLEKAPDARFASADQLVSELEARGKRAAARRPWLPLGAGAALLVAALGGGRWLALGGGLDPLGPPAARLACPPLAVSGPPARDGWLGAAAASTVCWRAGVARWTGALPPVAFPAELLGVPLTPSEATPADPYGAPDAREKAVAAAKQLGAAWVDGQVAYEREQFVVHLELKTPSGDALARGDATNRLLFEAVRAAMEPLWGPGRISLPEKLPAEQAQLLGSEAPMVAVAVKDLQLAIEAGSGIEAAAARLEPHVDRSGVVQSQVEYGLAMAKGRRSSVQVALDRASPLLFARTAVLAAETGTPMDAAAVADELKGLRAAAHSPVAQRALLEAEARVRLAAGQNEETTNLVLAGIDQFRFTDAWEVLAKSQAGRLGVAGSANAFAAWSPHIPGARGTGAGLEGQLSPVERQVTLYERQALLGPDSRIYTVLLGLRYLAAGRLGDARLLAARSLSRPELRKAGEVVLFLVECGEARFRAALARATRLISAAEHMGAVEDGDWFVVSLGHTVARLVGEQEAFVELVYRRLLATEPPRIDRGPWAVTWVAVACPFGAPEVATACAARIQRLVEAGYFYDLTPADRSHIAGAAAFTRGDYAGAVAEFRNGALNDGRLDKGIVAEAFDRTGDFAMASNLDTPLLATRGLFNGATFGHVREARRAAARGDRETARALAQRVVDAWSVADVDVPVVTEMRALLQQK